MLPISTAQLNTHLGLHEDSLLSTGDNENMAAKCNIRSTTSAIHENGIQHKCEYYTVYTRHRGAYGLSVNTGGDLRG